MHTYPSQDNVWTGRLQLSPWRRPARRKSGSYLLLLIHVCVIAPFQLVEYNHVKCHATIIAPHDDVIKWKHFPRYWPFVQGIHRSPMNSPHKGQWRGALMFSLMCVWINGWVNNREAGDLRCHRAHYDVTVITLKWERPLGITSTETPGLSKWQRNLISALQWRHNGHDGVSNHQPSVCLLRVFIRADQRKHQSSASLAFVWGIRRGPVNSPHKWPVRRKMFPFDDIIMKLALLLPRHLLNFKSIPL